MEIHFCLKYRGWLLWPAGIFFLLNGFPAKLSAQSRLPAAIQKVATSSNLREAGLSICVIDVSSAEVVGEFQPDQALIPASTLKLMTTATALALLGPEYRFRTELLYDGEIDSRGVLRGNLYLKGYGDPTLGSGKMPGTMDMDGILKKWIQAVQKAGIRQVEGYVVGDGSHFDAAVGNPSWLDMDVGNYYAAGAWGLNLHENLYFLRFQQTATLGKTPPVAQISPAIPGLKFTNLVKSAGRGSGDQAYIYGGPYVYEKTIRGSIPVGSGWFTIKGAVPDGPLFAAQQLANALEGAGISCGKGPATDRNLKAAPRSRRLLVMHYSPTLREIVKRANTESVNLYCEALLCAIGMASRGIGSREAGIQTLNSFWKDRGLDPSLISLYDGSGLSPENRMSSRFQAAMLRKAALDKNLFPALNASLPAAGESGILKNRFKGTAAVGRLRAKSGTLDRVRAYAGYARNPSGKLLAFSMLVNQYAGSGETVRQQLEQIMLTLCQE